MNITEVKKVLPHLTRNKIVPMFWGNSGVGKTQVVTQYAAERNLELVVLHLGTQEVGDLIGLLMRDGDTVRHARPSWFPVSGSGIVYLDEINRAPNDVLQAMFSFILSGTLHTHQLPPGWSVVAAGNYMSDRFAVTNTGDAAWLSRFCHIDFTPSVEEFCIHMETKRPDSHMAEFIRDQPNMLELSAKDAGRLDASFVVPDRRACEMVDRLHSEGKLPVELQLEVYSGIVGMSTAAAFLAHTQKKEKGITLKEVLRDYAKVRPKVAKLTAGKSKRFDALNGPIDELFLHIDKEPQYLAQGNRIDNLKNFLLDLPKELSMKLIVQMGKRRDFAGRHEIINDAEFVSRLVQ